jgi:hypothetical protein
MDPQSYLSFVTRQKADSMKIFLRAFNAAS